MEGRRLVRALAVFAAGLLCYITLYSTITNWKFPSPTAVVPDLSANSSQKVKSLSSHFSLLRELSFLHTGSNGVVKVSDEESRSQNQSFEASQNHSNGTGSPLNNSTADGLTNNTKLAAPNVTVITPTKSNSNALAAYLTGYKLPNKEICPNFGANLSVAILVTSAPDHKKHRLAIRQTWGHYGSRSDVMVAFFIGDTTSAAAKKTVEEEVYMYNDVIVGNFLDSYKNLTFKSLFMLKWMSLYCHEAPFLLKTDDDMFINVKNLLTFVQKNKNDKRTIFGHLAHKWKPIRNPKSKYYVTPAQFKGTHYPDFLTGPAYLLTTDIIQKLFDVALNSTFLPLEDVFITGIVGDKLKIKKKNDKQFVNDRVKHKACNFVKAISIHMVKFEEQFDIWKIVSDGKAKCPG